MSGEWGYAMMPDGTAVPLEEPQCTIPEEDRLVVVDRPGLKMWISKEEVMPTIESPEYEETRQRLMQDTIVIAMAEEIKKAKAAGQKLPEMYHQDGTPKFAFMMNANREYRRRGGTDGGHLGAIAEAIIRLLDG